MADNVPEGFDDEVISQLERSLGSNWPDALKQKWGDDWAELCATEMTRELGSEWRNESADSKVAALTAMIGDQADGASDADVPDPSQDEWVQTFDGVGSFEEWLARIGVPAEEVARLGDGGDVTADVPDPSQDTWVQTFDGVGSFEEWLVRIGVPAGEVRSLPQP